MNILIVENEIYLAQSIAAKLSENGFSCEIVASVKDALSQEDIFEVVLLSTNISGQDFYPVIEAYKERIIILMVSYISHDTVTMPLNAGANDYILKPFMIEELIRKIEHFLEFERLKLQNQTFQDYCDYLFQDIELPEIPPKIQFPFFIYSNYQKYSDAFAFDIAKKMQENLIFISLKQKKALQKVKKAPSNHLLYITDFQNLKKNEKEQFLELIQSKRAIVSTTEMDKILENFDCIELRSEHAIFDREDILTIDEYIRYILINYQNRFPDTVLSKKLGISRKSLWEKRKKYEIFKRK